MSAASEISFSMDLGYNILCYMLIYIIVLNNDKKNNKKTINNNDSNNSNSDSNNDNAASEISLSTDLSVCQRRGSPSTASRTKSPSHFFYINAKNIKWVLY